MHDLDFLRFATDDARALVGVDRRTWGRWLTGHTRIPSAVLALLRILVQGELPQGGDAWAGWRFHRGKLYSETGDSFAPNELRALPLLYARLAAARVEIERLRRSAALAEPSLLRARR